MEGSKNNQEIKIAQLEQIAQKFTELDPELKSKIVWYLLGMQEEREKHERMERN